MTSDQTKRAKIERRQYVDWLIANLNDLADHPEQYSPGFAAEMSRQAALALRDAHPIDYSLPPTACADQLSIHEACNG